MAGFIAEVEREDLFQASKQINPFASTGLALQLQPCVKLIATGTIWEQLAGARAS